MVTEFAVVAPVFFLMVVGFLEFGRALMVQQVLINASRVGARQRFHERYRVQRGRHRRRITQAALP
jgi:Flp pilus assembly protein TadG